MELYSESKNYKLYQGNMLDMLDKIEENSIDSIITDPPYELNFMGKGWDNAGVSFNKETWEKCLKVLKPGGYLLAFGGSRTFHRIACAIEDAGFDIRDTIMWIYGSGFPKSMNVGKGIEAKEKLGNAGTRNKRKIEQACDGETFTIKQTNNGAMGEVVEQERKEYVPGTEKAKEWFGWGTCLKPAFEPIIVARKPFEGSLVENVLKNGIGALNIEECRVPTTDIRGGGYENKEKGSKGTLGWVTNKKTFTDGRFPANVILTYDETDKEEVIGGFPNTKGSTVKEKGSYGFCFDEGKRDSKPMADGYNDNGSASRYFYCAKASKKDRDEGLEGKNTHCTVKPCELMQYLVRLVSPKGSTILDCFNGSGSTGKAVMYENKERDANYKYIGIELTEEYLPIAKARIEYVENKIEPKQESLF